jgi:hypothetical protein
MNPTNSNLRLKTTVVIAVLLLLASSAVLIAKTRASSNKAAITSVLTQRTQAANESWFEGKKRRTFDGRQFQSRLRKISLSACPMRFQIAWKDYLYAMGKEQGFVHQANVLTSLLHLQVVESNEAADAWHRCEIVAFEFGVSMPREPQ